MGLRPLEYVRWKFFIAIAIHLKALTIVPNVSVDVARVLDPLLNDNILSYYTKAILPSLMSEF